MQIRYLSIFFLLFLFSSCHLKNSIVIDDVPPNKEEISIQEILTTRDSLDLLFNYIYSDTSKIAEVTFYDSEQFYGYEYVFDINGSSSNPWRLSLYQNSELTEDYPFFVFWMGERVYHDNADGTSTYSHSVTGNNYAVNIETKEIIEERIYDDMGLWEINEKFPHKN